MNLEECFLELISRKNHDLFSQTLRGLLYGSELPYATFMCLRNLFYDRDWSRSFSVNVPVVSVGNLTLGGTGKTPLVAHLTQWALNRKIRPGLVSRGYRKGRQKPSDESPSVAFESTFDWSLNDEGRELAIRFPNVPHVQSPDRFAAASRLLAASKVGLLILDDAFQHRRMKRNLDIVLLDSREPFGYGHVFPGGLLRESIRSLDRAGIVLLSRADAVSESRRLEIRRQVEQLAPEAVWGEVVHKPIALVSYFQSSPRNDSQINTELSGFFGQRTAPLAFLEGKRVFAFSGIARPDSFRKTLLDGRAEVVRFESLSDHHDFTDREIERLAAEAKNCDAEIVLCTMKDLVKIRKRTLAEKELWALAIGIEFLQGEEEFDRRLEGVIRNLKL